MSVQYYEGVGRRKTSTARARIFSGDGTITCNNRPATDYFPRLGDLDLVMAPLKAVGLLEKFSVSIKVMGGGVTGQTDAVKLGLARALVNNLVLGVTNGFKRGLEPVVNVLFRRRRRRVRVTDRVPVDDDLIRMICEEFSGKMKGFRVKPNAPDLHQ